MDGARFANALVRTNASPAEVTWKAGVDVLDLNVLLTSDGQLLVQHDDSVDRNTNGTGKVADMSLAQIQALDAAYAFGAGTAAAVSPVSWRETARLLRETAMSFPVKTEEALSGRAFFCTPLRTPPSSQGS